MQDMRRTLLTLSVLASVAVVADARSAIAQPIRSGTASVERMREWSEGIAYTYLRRWSSGNAAALADVHQLYGPRVSFHGEFVDQRNLSDQKRRFGHRWPIRRYEHRPGTMRVTCDAVRQACLVKSIIDWQAASPARHAFSRGSSTFELGIGFSGPKPVVLFERGHVIRHGPQQAQAW
jgi:hypothetical protein